MPVAREQVLLRAHQSAHQSATESATNARRYSNAEGFFHGSRISNGLDLKHVRVPFDVRKACKHANDELNFNQIRIASGPDSNHNRIPSSFHSAPECRNIFESLPLVRSIRFLRSQQNFPAWSLPTRVVSIPLKHRV